MPARRAASLTRLLASNCSSGMLVSIDAIARLFVERASFSQSYDMGAQGRFARHFLGP